VKQALDTHYTLNDLVEADTNKVSINNSAANQSGQYDNKDAATDKQVTFTGIGLTGDEAGNYSIATSLSGNVGTIEKKGITATLNDPNGTYVFTKVYDGNNRVTEALGNNYAFGATDIIANDEVSIDANTSGIYTAGKNVGDSKNIQFTGVKLTGSDAGNYLIGNSLSGTVGRITPRKVTAAFVVKNGDGADIFTKIYDGTKTVNQSLGTNYTLSNVVEGEESKIGIATSENGEYSDKNVGDGKTITFGGITLTGDERQNYSIEGTLSGAAGQITPKTLKATLADPNGTYYFTKVYDGTQTVQQALGNHYAFDSGDFISGDENKVSIAANTSGLYSDKTAGDDKVITFSNIKLIGDEAKNYAIADTLSGAVGQVTPKHISATLNDPAGTYVFTKVYNNTITVDQPLGSNYTFGAGNVANGDDVRIAANTSGVYLDQNAGDAKEVGNLKPIEFSSIMLTGTDAGNYTIDSVLSGNVGQITPAIPEHPYFDTLASLTGQQGNLDGAPNGNDGFFVPQLPWYQGPTLLTIINGGIQMPKDILLGSTYDSRTVIVSDGGKIG